MRAENFEGLSSRIVCARNLEPPHPTPPHPGDAGQGGGELIEGDCLVAGGGTSPDAFQVGEAPCSAEGWFGTVVAVAATPDERPDAALSRITSPFIGGGTLCAAPDGPDATGGTMLAPGECTAESPLGGGGLMPPPPGDCASPTALRIVGFADAGGACPQGGDPVVTSGYDRQLCLAPAGG